MLLVTLVCACWSFSASLAVSSQERESAQVAPLHSQKAGTVTRQTGYRVVRIYTIGGEGYWDYITIDGTSRKLFVSHGNQVEVLDADSGRAIGRIVETTGVHGISIAEEFSRGFTSNGDDSTVTMFDTNTLKTLRKIQLQTSCDFILYDHFSKRVFALDEKTSVIDARTGALVGIVELGGDAEAAVTDEKGLLYVNLKDKNAIAVVDSKSLNVLHTYFISGCVSPHSLSYDPINGRLFVGCRGRFAVLDAKTGKSIANAPMCSGVDGSGFDVENKLIFESCGEATLSIIRQVTPDRYELIDNIRTQLHARTMAFDPVTKNIYLPTAEFETTPNEGSKHSQKAKIKSDSFSVLVLGKSK